MSHPLEQTASNVADIGASAIAEMHWIGSLDNLSSQEWLLQILAFNARAFILLCFCLLLLRAVKGSAANRHFLLFSALCAVTFLPLVHQLLPAVAVEMEVIQANLPMIPITVQDYIEPLNFNRVEFASMAPTINWFQACLAIYMLTSCFLLTKILWENSLVYLLSKISKPIYFGDWYLHLEQEQNRLGLPQTTKLFTSKHIASPITWGNSSPVIIIPIAALQWSPHLIRSTIAHELAHIKRRDWLAQQISHLICVCFWINPLCWHAYKKLSTYAEAACDDIALASGIKNIHYANDLLNVARNNSQRLFSLAAIGMASASHTSELTQRVTAILKPDQARHPNSWRVIFITWLLVSGLLLPFASLKANFVQVIETAVPLSTTTAPATRNRSPFDFNRETLDRKTFDSETFYLETVVTAEIAPPVIRRYESLDFEGFKVAATREFKKRLTLLNQDFGSTNAEKMPVAATLNAAPIAEVANAKPKEKARSSAASNPKNDEKTIADAEHKQDVDPLTHSEVELYAQWSQRRAAEGSSLPTYASLSLGSTHAKQDVSVVESYSRKKVVVPKYPRLAEERGIEGEVIVEFSIDERGQVIDPVIIDAQPNKVFNRNVLRAIKDFTFTPHRIDGDAVTVDKVREVFVFKIEA